MTAPETHLCILLLCMLAVACAGREPDPIPTSNLGDGRMSCLEIRAEITGNNQRIEGLSNNADDVRDKNVMLGMAGVIVWPVWFFMDFKGTDKQEARALEARNTHLGQLYVEKRCYRIHKPAT